MTRQWGMRGMTLVELMVALALGLLIVLAAGTTLVVASSAFAAQAQAAAIDDAGRFALELIGRSARQTAFVDLDRDGAALLAADGPARIAGADAATMVKGSAGMSDLRAGAINGSDVLALRFNGAGAAPDGDGSVLSCAGFSVPADADGWSIFYVAKSSHGVAELRCKYRADTGWSADAVVGGVDAFQVLYGLDTDAPADGVANRFLSASAIEAIDAALTPEGDTPADIAQDRQRRSAWKRIASIKVALLLHGRERSSMDRELGQYALLGEAYARVAAGDAGVTIREADLPPDLRYRERRLFTATILLRNAG